VGDRLALDVSLTVGEISETISVSAEAPLLRTQDAQTGEVVTEQFIQNLPQLSRDPMALVRLSGNVQGTGNRAMGAYFDGRGSEDTRINGGRSQGIEYFVDGASAGTGRGHNISNTAVPTMEGVAEFKVITNGFSSEYGRLSGGAVEVVSKNGTNRFHGQAFDYIQNTILNANSWQNNTDSTPTNQVKKDQFNQNIFGGAVGGPIFKDKTFFFANYEGTRYIRAGSNFTTSVPTAAARTGDLTGEIYNGVPFKVYNPFSTHKDASGNWVRDIFPNNGTMGIPVSPYTAAILKDYPLPNSAPQFGSTAAGNYKAYKAYTHNNDTWAVRIDHNFSDKSRINGRFSRYGDDNGETNPLGLYGNPSSTYVKGAFGASINYTYDISANKIFTARIGGHFDQSGF
jgi:hypothetical protein